VKSARAKRQPVRIAAHSAAARSSARPAGSWRRIAALLGWSASIVAVGWGMVWLEREVRTAQVGVGCELEWVDLPDWLTSDRSGRILRDIAAAADPGPGVELRDPDLCRRITEGLQRSPWVAEVQRVSKQADGRIRVRALYREPFALVELNGSAYLVDRAGVRLPMQYEVAKVEDHYWNEWFRIVGVAGAVPAEGAAWGGDDLGAGLRLVEFLKAATARGEVPFRSSLRTVDVANYKLRGGNKYDGELRIRTLNPRCYINWGLPPGEEYGVEPGAQRKVDMLRAVYAKRGQLPDNIIDVRDASGTQIGQPPWLKAPK
jgi:hypothetical protein